MYLTKPNLFKNILKFTIIVCAILIISMYLYLIYNHFTGARILN